MDDAFAGMGPLGTYGEEDLRSWAAAGSSPGGFEAVLHAVARACFLSSTIGPSHGRAVEGGLAAEEAAATLALAAYGVEDWAQLRAKRLALRPRASAGASCLLGAIVRAALAHDGRRLAAEARLRPRSRARPGSGGAGPRDATTLLPAHAPASRER